MKARTALDGKETFMLFIFYFRRCNIFSIEMGTDGSFKRVDAAWRDWICNEEGSKFKPEKEMSTKK